MMSVIGLVGPIRAANYLGQRALYLIDMYSVPGGCVHSECGFLAHTRPIAEHHPSECDFVIVVGGIESDPRRHFRIENHLRNCARHGVSVGSIGSACTILARAGLLDKKRCVAHSDQLEAFREVFPLVEASDSLFAFDRGVMTCAAGRPATDMILTLVESHHGHDLAQLAAQHSLHGEIRPAVRPQRGDIPQRLGIHHPKLVEAVGIMERSVDGVLSLRELAAEVGMTRRALERQFEQRLHMSPARYFRRLRLNRAQRLLRQTSLSVTQVAVASGFATPSHFAKSYRVHFGITPREERGARQGTRG